MERVCFSMLSSALDIAVFCLLDLLSLRVVDVSTPLALDYSITESISCMIDSIDVDLTISSSPGLFTEPVTDSKS